MHVVIAGSGDLARYICEEFTKAGHTLTVLTRTQKPELDQPGVEQHVTNYSLPSLMETLDESEVLISTISDFTASFVDVHRALIQACQASSKCKRFIASEFAGDIETYPEQPGFYWRTREPVREILRSQTDIEWTLVSNGWLADYLVPPRNRHIKDIGDAHPVDLSKRTMVIPGTGNEPINFTWARDIAKALAHLVGVPGWEPHTYISGERSCWNKVAALLEEAYQIDLKTTHVSLYEITESVRTAKDENSLFLADHHLFSISHASSLPEAKVTAHREKYFRGIRFRTLIEGLSELEGNLDLIL
ncbi:NADH(P)-binding domain-containing protein [Purpureocillium lavendulum]|uniref:NADH(P)-binding domain-containing protein n=1 Tax=Purpureocillium lavendulum TaxID=1247861 RepID=A0AB34G0C6_9HYPO|nr:NADH(P)-binding domain-containing protein [Purpureocillium lavendulum]